MKPYLQLSYLVFDEHSEKIIELHRLTAARLKKNGVWKLLYIVNVACLYIRATHNKMGEDVHILVTMRTIWKIINEVEKFYD